MDDAAEFAGADDVAANGCIRWMVVVEEKSGKPEKTGVPCWGPNFCNKTQATSL